jgi:hypothetical protein
MKTFYSIVYATIRPDISEKLSLGLIFVSDNKVYCRFSIHKTNLLKHLLPAGPLKSIKLGLKNINSKLNKSQASANDASIITFDNTVNQAEFSLSYLDYLSNRLARDVYFYKFQPKFPEDFPNELDNSTPAWFSQLANLIDTHYSDESDEISSILTHLTA